MEPLDFERGHDSLHLERLDDDGLMVAMYSTWYDREITMCLDTTQVERLSRYINGCTCTTTIVPVDGAPPVGSTTPDGLTVLTSAAARRCVGCADCTYCAGLYLVGQ